MDGEYNETLEDQMDPSILPEKLKNVRKRKDYSSVVKRRSIRIKKQSKKVKCMV